MLGALEAARPQHRGDRFDPDAVVGGAAVGAGLGGAGARVRGAAHALRQARRHARCSSSAMSPRKARSPGRACSSTSSTPCSTSRAIRIRLPPGARGEEPLRRGERARRVRHDRERAARGQQSVGAVPVPARETGARLLRAGHAGRHAAAAGRDPGAGRRGAYAQCAPPLRRAGANRLAMLLAVLHRHAGIATWEQDVFVNAVGGVRIGEPAADLAVCLAVVSSLTDKPIPAKVAVFGEIGLAGEVRPAPRGQERLQGGRQARLREGDRAEGQCAEGEDRRPGGPRGRAHRPGGAAAARALVSRRQTGGGFRSGNVLRWCQ